MIIADLDLKNRVDLVKRLELEFEGVTLTDREALQSIKAVSQIRMAEALADDMEFYVRQHQILIAKIDKLLKSQIIEGINFNCPVALLAGTKIIVNSPYNIKSSPFGSTIGYEEIEGEVRNACFINGHLSFVTLDMTHSQGYTANQIVGIVNN